MKFILCVTVFTSIVVRNTQAMSDTIDLIPFGLFSELEDGPKVIDAEYVNFAGVHKTASIDQLSALSIEMGMTKLVDLQVYSPFIIHMKFKITKQALTSIFSLEEGGKVTTMVRIEPANSELMRLVLVLAESEEISFDIPVQLDKWNDVLLYVMDGKVKFYIDCEEIDEKSINGTKLISFSKDASLVLGKTEKYSAYSEFEGSIKELRMYTEADDDLKMSICPSKLELDRMNSMFMSPTNPTITTTDYDTEDTSAGELEPANIVRGDMGDNPTYNPEDYTNYDEPTTAAPIPAEKGEKGDLGERGERGFKGEKGEKGTSGLKGEPGESNKGEVGPIGPQGPEGIAGRRGEEGKCSCSESVVSTLLKTMPEMKGPRGERGPTGEDGPRGLTGATGAQGPQGEIGPSGLNGEKGERGNDGKPGSNGKDGEKGEPGRDGPQGPTGLQGVAGPPGPPGPGYVPTEADKKVEQIPGEKGEQGIQGPPGLQGPRGDRGERGEKGDQGLTGEKGDKGHKGSEGPRGLEGKTGAPGNDGPAGEPGRHGRNGESGEKGERGDKGSPGLPGLSANINELLDSNMDPHENAKIVEKLRGFKGDKGTTGEKGSKGDRGETGLPGEPGKDGNDGDNGKEGSQGPKGEKGSTGLTGPRGLQGEPGPPGLVPESAIALMKGPKGTRGPGGPRGYKGQKGTAGNKGSKGDVGPKGGKGDQGLTGPMGPMGLPGYNGTNGEKGEKGECLKPDYSLLRGEKGDRGESGVPGFPGEQGPAGPPGKCDQCNRIPTDLPPGPPGPPGPAGFPGRPGVSVFGPKGEPGEPGRCSGCNELFEDDPDIQMSKTVIFKNEEVLLRKTQDTPPGTLAYVVQENILLIRVQVGWKYVQMGSDYRPRREISANQKPFTPRPQYNQVEYRPPPKITGSGYIRLAALNNPYSGRVMTANNKQGLAAAEHLCNQAKGNFRPFLSSSRLDLRKIVNNKDRHLPVTNIMGEELFPSWESMFDGSEARMAPGSNIYSFNNMSVLIDDHWPIKEIWHGSDRHGYLQTRYSCKEWDSDNHNDIGVSSPLGEGKLLGSKGSNCDNKLIVLCVEVSASNRKESVTEKPLPRLRHQWSRHNDNYENNDIYRN